MSKSQRTKGSGAERELCSILTENLGEKISRRLGQARDSGHDVDIPGFRIEVKRRAKIAVYQWMAQINRACPGGAQAEKVTPIVAMRADGERWLVLMDLQDWIELIREEVANAIQARG